MESISRALEHASDTKIWIKNVMVVNYIPVLAVISSQTFFDQQRKMFLWATVHQVTQLMLDFHKVRAPLLASFTTIQRAGTPLHDPDLTTVIEYQSCPFLELHSQVMAAFTHRHQPRVCIHRRRPSMIRCSRTRLDPHCGRESASFAMKIFRSHCRWRIRVASLEIIYVCISFCPLIVLYIAHASAR